MSNNYLSEEAFSHYKDKLEVVGLSHCPYRVDYNIETLSKLNLIKQN